MVKILKKRFKKGYFVNQKSDGIYMDGILKDNLDTVKVEIRNDFDMVFIVDGKEGAGKSMFTFQIALFCDPTFNLDHIAFTPDQFKEKVVNAKKYQAIVFDEAFSGLYSRNAMTYINIQLISMLAEIRQKNLFIFIVLPTFFDLDRYVAIWRSISLIHVYLTEGFTRGSFLFFGSNKKKDLYMKGYKIYNYRVEKSNFYGSFHKYWVIDKKEYEKSKLKNLRTYANKFGSESAIEQRNKLIKLCCDEKILTQRELGKIIGCSDRLIRQILREMRLRG